MTSPTNPRRTTPNDLTPNDLTPNDLPPDGLTPDDLTLDDVLDGGLDAFALVHRPQSGPADRIELLAGPVGQVERLADLTGPAAGSAGRGGHDLLAVIPYRQVSERGYACHDDGEPVLTLAVRASGTVPVSEALTRIPDVPVRVRADGFDLGDDEYAAVVRDVLAEEIGRGEGANFVIRRTYIADLEDASPAVALSVFRRLLAAESGAYWTFVVHLGKRTFVGASPERHVSLADGRLVMNPISGTHRHGGEGTRLSALLDFLADPKEADELAMVVDEELKMMARTCHADIRVEGPYLKEMARVAHTEYLLTGRSDLDARDVLTETMFAPTVTGSPLENATRVIARHEPTPRGYYSGVVALVGHDEAGGPLLDSAICIRTADIAGDRLRLGVGATLVRLSDPQAEAAETRAKAEGMLAALGVGAPARAAGPAAVGAPRWAEHPDVRTALARRNDTLSRFWLHGPDADPATAAARRDPVLAGRRVLVLDAEDRFTAMLGHQLASLGVEVRCVGWRDVAAALDSRWPDPDADLTVIGPGPGDPQDVLHPKIATMRRATGALLRSGEPFFSVCLGHQVLATVLGLPIVRRATPNQGVQKPVDVFGRTERVGFYNSFAAVADDDVLHHARVAGPIEVSRDAASGEVHALRGPTFASVQFHPESVLSERGVLLMHDLLVPLIPFSFAPALPA